MTTDQWTRPTDSTPPGFFRRNRVLVTALAATWLVAAAVVFQAGSWRWGQAGLWESAGCELMGGHEVSVLGLVHHCQASGDAPANSTSVTPTHTCYVIGKGLVSGFEGDCPKGAAPTGDQPNGG